MALSLKNPEVVHLARQLADETGEKITEAIRVALEERLQRTLHRRKKTLLRDEIERMQQRIAELPVLDSRAADDIIGYNEQGLPERG